MITAADPSAPIDPAPPMRPVRRRRTRIVVAICAVALSGTGLLMLQSGSSDGSSGPGLSSSGDFLQAASPTGIPRIRVWMDGSPTSLLNGDTIAIGDDVVLGVMVDPYPPTRFDIDVEFTLATPAGAPVTDARITIVWDMVIMGHGPFRTEMTSTGEGRYRAHLDLFMFGPWDLDVEIPSYDLPDDLSVSLYVWPE